VRSSAGLRPAAPDNHRSGTVIANHDSTYSRIGPCTPKPSPAERQCERHEAGVIGWVACRHVQPMLKTNDHDL
jgi:hypothetical protein